MPTVIQAASEDAEPLEAKLELLDGGKLRLEELRGEPVLLELWATWCLPCQAQARIVHSAAGDLERLGVRVLAVNQGEREKVVRKFVADHPDQFHYPVALDPRQVIAARLDVGELPALALLDRDGSLAELRLGLTGRDELTAMLAELERPPDGD